jgi:hypothetical protein
MKAYIPCEDKLH